MITCRRAAELISRELDIRLWPHQQAGLGYHTLLCGSCRRFRRQLGAVDEAVGELFATAAAGVSGTTLPPDTRGRLKAVIVEYLDGEA